MKTKTKTFRRTCALCKRVFRFTDTLDDPSLVNDDETIHFIDAKNRQVGVAVSLGTNGDYVNEPVVRRENRCSPCDDAIIERMNLFF